MTPAAVTAGKPVPTGQTQAAEGERERECCGLQSWRDAPGSAWTDIEYIPVESRKQYKGVLCS